MLRWLNAMDIFPRRSRFLFGAFITVTIVAGVLIDIEIRHRNLDRSTPAATSMTQTQSQQIELARYVPYSQAAFDAASDEKRVLYFYASWCSTCTGIDLEMSEHQERIPANMVVFKVDFDAQRELKQRYGVTLQHTFVLVDKQGNSLMEWSGGDLEELIARTQ